MIKDVLIIEQNGMIVEYNYKGYTYWSNIEDFQKMTKEDFEKNNKETKKTHEEIKKLKAKCKEVTEADKTIFDRWQSENGHDD